VTHPDKKPEFDFHVAQIFFDIERMIPLRYAAYMWPEDGGDPPVEEEYTYLDVKLNVGLTDEDFNPDNKSYKFP
jgi:outer membrane lipoprotein-sorting protein